MSLTGMRHVTYTVGVNVPEEPKREWTTTELAERAGVSQAYVRQLILAGEIRARKVGRDWIISNTEAQRWLENRGK